MELNILPTQETSRFLDVFQITPERHGELTRSIVEPSDKLLKRWHSTNRYMTVELYKMVADLTDTLEEFCYLLQIYLYSPTIFNLIFTKADPSITQNFLN